MNILNTCLCRLTAFWQKNGPQPGKPLRRTIIGDFPDASSAEGFLKENNPAGNWPYLFCYQLEPMPEYRDDYSYPVTIFDRNGNIRGGYDNNKFDCFPGRLEADCRFKLADFVQLGDHKLVLGVVVSLPPDPAFVAQMGDESGMLDDADDSYLVLYGKRGKEHGHLHECELFAPDAPIPRYLTVLRQTVLTGIRQKSPPVREFHQKKLFFKWLENNKQLFSHEPYFAEEGDISFSMRFNGITGNISCCFIEKGDIVILAYYRNEVYDIVMDFDLYEEQAPDGRFWCSMCPRDSPCGRNPQNTLGYETREELWIKHSFEPLAQWTREAFTDDAVLCLYRYGGGTAAQIASGEKLRKLRTKGGISKEIPVIISRTSISSTKLPTVR